MNKFYSTGVCLLLLMTLVVSPAWADALTELGKPRMEVFPPHAYGGHNQVFQTVADSKGILYATNYGAVLAYDGERWDRIPIPGAGFLYGLARYGDDRLVVCGVNTIGLLEPGASGQWTFNSLAGQLELEEGEQLGELWDLFVVGESIYVFSRRQMMRFTPSGADVWEFVTEEMIYGFWSGSGVYIQVLGDGLYRLEDDEPRKISEAELFRRPGPRLLLDRGDGLLVATIEQGLWTWTGDEPQPFAPRTSALLETAFVNRGVHLPDGRLALGTFEKGVMILSPEGDVERIVDETSGLPGNTVTHLSSGRGGALWVSLNNGLARVETDDHLTLYDRDLGLPPVSVTGILRHQGSVYLNSNNGLFRLRAVPTPGPARWENLPGVEGEVNSMIQHGEDLFLANRGKALRFDGESIHVLWDESGLLRVLHSMKSRTDHVLVGGRIGLALLYHDGDTWTQAGPVPDLQDHVLSIAESTDGSIWLGTVYSGILRLKSTGKGDTWIPEISIERYGEAEGLPSLEHVIVREEGGSVRALTAKGIVQFDTESGRFAPYQEQGSLLPPEGWAWDVQVEIPGLGAWGSVYPLAGAEDDFNLYFGVRTPEKDWKWIPPGIFESIGGLLYLYWEKDDRPVLWAGGWAGLMRWEPDLQSMPGWQVGPIGPIFREIELADGTRAFGGAGEPKPFTFQHTRGSTRFRYAAPLHDPGVAIEYRSRLDPFDANWTAWEATPERSFTNLPAGDYTFHLEARTASGPLAQPATASFSVLPPWYQTPVAWALYMLAGLGLISGGVRLRMAALRKENRLLEERVAQRTAELAQSESNLRVARDAAEQANEAKSRFLANMSHELRTPLNAIMGYAKILERDPDLDERNRERTRILNSSSQLLLHLINEVLDLSKIEAGRIEMHKAPVDLRRSVSALVESFRPRAEQKGLSLVFELDPEFPEAILTDIRKIEQILFNLVGNALKFTSEGEVRVAATLDGYQYCIRVSDTGCGIPEKDRQSVFEPFFQSAGAEEREPGTGLGLSICKRLAEALGGDIHCLGQSQGGTLFEVRLPLESTSAEGRAVDEEKRLAGYAGERRCLLVVDDVRENRDVISELLEPLGFTVQQAASGEAAIERIREGGIDLMFLDFRMSPMSGEALLQRLKDLPETDTLAIVSYSASLIGFTREDALAMGCDDWLPKPFLPEDLFSILEKLLRLQWVRAETPPPPSGDPDFRFQRKDLEELRALAFRREPGGLKERLNDIREREPDSAAVVDPLLKWLAAFRLAEIGRQLDACQPREEA